MRERKAAEEAERDKTTRDGKTELAQPWQEEIEEMDKPLQQPGPGSQPPQMNGQPVASAITVATAHMGKS